MGGGGWRGEAGGMTGAAAGWGGAQTRGSAAGPRRRPLPRSGVGGREGGGEEGVGGKRVAADLPALLTQSSERVRLSTETRPKDG